ncbi:MAG TPA: bifunctional lysylphosphatidylglycerol flippase/synthetase MprF, partial [Pseudomonadales bacterium]|nr:bifunctional lysylphosphatidylglycerol flippase/synthetase MprF [Pseudomonadales bacterium]
LIISGTLPGIRSRLHLLTRFMPLSLLEFSHLANSAIGVGLLIVARGLYLRLRGAYDLAMVLLLGGILVSLGKGLDFEESIAMAMAAALLYLFRKEFYRPAPLFEQQFPTGWMLSIIGVLAASLWIGFFVYKHVEYRNALWWQFAVDANAPRMLRGTLVAMLVAIAFGLSRLTKSPPPKPELPDKGQLARAKAVIANSDSSSANLALLGDKRLLFHPSDEAFIMYQVSGDSWIALGDPIGNPEHYETLAWQFRELADRYADRCAFYQVTEENLPLYVDMGFSLSKLGEEARVPLEDFSLEGSKRADLRHAHSRALRDGVSFEIIPSTQVASYLPELAGISAAWLTEKRSSEKGFSLGAFSPSYLVNFDCAIVRKDGVIVAFANLWQSAFRHEVSIDLMRYNAEAPPGTMDYLFSELMIWARAEGFKWFILGMAPLSGLEMRPLSSLWHKIGNSIFRFGENFYNFEGLRRYKQKFNPQWQSVYLAAPGGLAFPRILLDATLLISGGRRRFVPSREED